MKKTMIAFAALISMSSFAHADVPECEGSSTMEMKMCADNKYTIADAQLNAAYASLKAQILKSEQSDEVIEVDKRLVQAQRDWIKFRDSDCNLEAAEMLNGTAEGLVFLGCVTEKTIQRTKELNNLKKVFAGR